MTSSRIYLHYLQDMVENAAKALQFVQGMSGDDFLRDEKTFFAVIRALEVIGEAAKNIPDPIREKYPQIPCIKSCHAKDILLGQHLTVHLDEVRPGQGNLDYPAFLKGLNRLNADLPLMLEHLPNEAEYREAASYIREVAAREGLAL